MLRTFLLLLFSISTLISHQLQINKVGESFKDFEVLIYKDKTSSLTFEQVKKLDQFEIIKNSFSEGQHGSSIWFKFSIENNLEVDSSYIIKFSEFFLDSVEFFILSTDGTYKSDKRGVLHSGKTHFDITKLNVSISIPKKDKKVVFIRLDNKFSYFGSIEVLDKEAFYKEKYTHDLLMAFYFGAILSLLIYNLIIFISTKDITYFFYVAYVGFFSIWQLLLSGFFPSDTSAATFHFSHSVIPMWIGLLYFFTGSLLEIKKQFPKLGNFITYTGYFYIFLGVLSWYNLLIAFTIYNITSTFLLPFLVYIGFKSMFAGNKIAIYFVTAQITFLVSATLFSWMAGGFLEYNFINRYSIVIGSFVEILLFALALASKFNMLKTEKEQAVKQKNMILERSKHELEKKIKERTQELEEKNIELEKISITDNLTTLYNRKRIDEVLENELHRAQRYKKSFGLMIIDADHFKSVNDRYGHQVGDQVLIGIAKILNSFSRDTDVIGRWGGEEFFIICPETKLEGVMKLAETLREEIEKYEFPKVKQQTVSIGVTEYKDNDAMKDIISRADKALYLSKESGRNRSTAL